MHRDVFRVLLVAAFVFFSSCAFVTVMQACMLLPDSRFRMSTFRVALGCAKVLGAGSGEKQPMEAENRYDHNTLPRALHPKASRVAVVVLAPWSEPQTGPGELCAGGGARRHP